MKNIFKYIIVSVLAAGLVSCNFLDENMDTKFTTEQIYGTEPALETAVMGCYASFGSVGFKSGSMNEWFQPASALIHWGGVSGRLTDGQKRWVDCLSLTRFAKDPNNLSNFKALYSTIYKCNKLISELPGCPVSESFKTEIEAEARFIRAESFFYLTRIWGDVPVNLEVPTTVEQTNGPREPFWKVYGVILDDLDFAEKNMRDYETQYSTRGISKGSGRVCNTAATAAKSIVYLTIGTLLKHSEPNDNFWMVPNEQVFKGFEELPGEHSITSADDAFTKALKYAELVIPETNPASPHRLAENYADLFRWTEPEDFQIRERIFCLTSCNELSSNSTLAMWSLPQQYMGTDKATNFGRVRPSRFLFQKWCETYGPKQAADADYFIGCADPRIDVAFIYNSYPGADMATKKCYPDASGVYGKDTDYTATLPYFKKYYDPKYNYTAGYADLYVIRLAEIYLVAAEACANLGVTDKAIEYANYVVGRANIMIDNQKVLWKESDFEPVKPGETSQDVLIRRIFWERCFELTGEQHEYYDTHRMGARWLGENVTGPHNEFLTRPEQQAWYLAEDGKTKVPVVYGEDSPENATRGHRELFYGTERRISNATSSGKGIYPEIQTEVRKGLIHAYPNDELVYNTSLTLADQNPSEIFWE